MSIEGAFLPAPGELKQGKWDFLGCPVVRNPYSCTSLVVQLVKNPPAMPETWVRPLGWDDPLEKGKATHSSIPAWRIPRTV